MSTSVDQASMDRGHAAYEVAIARGLVYHVTGRVGNIQVSTVNGEAHVSAQALPGESVQIALVKGAHDTIDFDRVARRGVLALPVGCADCEGSGGGSAPPQAQQTKPPNYDSCSAAGGATWFDEASGAGGCLGPGASRGFGCGTWSYASPGRGRFRSWSGNVDYSGFQYISASPDGVNCTLGPLT